MGVNPVEVRVLSAACIKPAKTRCFCFRSVSSVRSQFVIESHSLNLCDSADGQKIRPKIRRHVVLDRSTDSSAKSDQIGGAGKSRFFIGLATAQKRTVAASVVTGWPVSRWSVSRWSVSRWSINRWSINRWSISHWPASRNPPANARQVFAFD